jgi:hypothetical protein
MFVMGSIINPLMFISICMPPSEGEPLRLVRI